MSDNFRYTGAGPLMNLRSLPLASLLLLACSSDPQRPGDTAEPSPSGSGDGVGNVEAAAQIACASPRRYFATLREGSCASILTQGGSWEPEAAFPNAPEDIQSSTCIYQWVPAVGASRSAPVESAALV